jgi:hypothetical protein
MSRLLWETSDKKFGWGGGAMACVKELFGRNLDPRSSRTNHCASYVSNRLCLLRQITREVGHFEPQPIAWTNTETNSVTLPCDVTVTVDCLRECRLSMWTEGTFGNETLDVRSETKEWRKVHDKELRNLHSWHNSVRVMKWRSRLKKNTPIMPLGKFKERRKTQQEGKLKWIVQK